MGSHHSRKNQCLCYSIYCFHQNYTSKDISYQNLFQQIRYNRENHIADDSLLLLWEKLQKEFEEEIIDSDDAMNEILGE